MKPGYNRNLSLADNFSFEGSKLENAHIKWTLPAMAKFFSLAVLL
jgi:hypothetical protein